MEEGYWMGRKLLPWLYVTMATAMFSWQPKNVPWVNQLEKSVLRRCHNGVINDLGDFWWHCDVTLALTDVMVQEIDVRVPGDVTQVTNGTIVTINVLKLNLLSNSYNHSLHPYSMFNALLCQRGNPIDKTLGEGQGASRSYNLESVKFSHVKYPLTNVQIWTPPLQIPLLFFLAHLCPRGLFCVAFCMSICLSICACVYI